MEPFDPLVPNDLLPPVPVDHHISQAQAASMRRKKNADAQAAFRARRANYIASLEETVTSLEAVVLSLQDACREARNDTDDLRHENTRLHSLLDAMKQAARDREKEWRDFWHAKQQALGLDESHMNDFPPRPVELSPPSPPRQQYVDDPQLRFPASEPSYLHTTTKDAVDQRYGPPPFPSTTADGHWLPGPFSNTRTPCVGEALPSQSSEASDSPPSISPGVQYSSSRFPLGEENRMSLVGHMGMAAAAAAAAAGPAYGGEPASPWKLTSDPRLLAAAAEQAGSLGVPEYDPYHGGRHALPDGGDHRYASGRQRRAYSGPNPRGGEVYAPAHDGGMHRATSPLQMTHAESEGLNGHGLDGGQMRPRRHTSASLLPHPHTHSSPSSSPPPPPPPPRERGVEPQPMSNTLAVIKAQAFGSLRRTRTRTKKASDSASKVAIDILAARGIGMGVQVAPLSGGGVGHRKRKSEHGDVEMGS